MSNSYSHPGKAGGLPMVITYYPFFCKEINLMKESGLVVNIKDDFAIIKVEQKIPADCCNKTTKKEACIIEARNHCNAKINNKVSVEIENTLNPSMKILMIVVCLIGLYISGLVLGEKTSAFPGLSPYKDLLSLGLAIILVIIAFAGFRCFSTKEKNTIPAVSGILYN
jgi:hypothetical protein